MESAVTKVEAEEKVAEAAVVMEESPKKRGKSAE